MVANLQKSPKNASGGVKILHKLPFLQDFINLLQM